MDQATPLQVAEAAVAAESKLIEESKLKYVKVYDPRVSIKPGGYYTIFQGASAIAQQIFPTTSFSTSQFSFNINPPSTWNSVDRHIKMRVYLQVQFSGAAPRLGVTDSLRQFPINNLIKTLTVGINSANINLNTSNYCNQLMRYGPCPYDRSRFYSTSASMPDQYPDYGDWTDPTFGGDARNPMSAYGQVGQEQSRGAILPYAQSLDGKTLQYILTEPLLFCSPFLYSGEEWDGFINVSQFLINIQLNSNMSWAVWSHDAINGPDIGTVTVSFFQAPEILLTFLSMMPDVDIPAQVHYPYNQVLEYNTGSAITLASGASGVAISQAIRLDQVPRRVYLFCRKSQGSLTYSDSDTCANINSVNITFNNTTGMLGSASEQDLFFIAQKNSYQQSWSQWHNFTGSVLALDFGEDLYLGNPIYAPGSKGQFMFQVTGLGVTNLTNASVTFDFWLVFILEGVFSLNEGTGATQIGILSSKDILDTKSTIPYHQYKNVYGGSVFSKLKHLVHNVASTVAPIAKVISQGAEAVGKFTEGAEGGAFAGYALAGRRRKGPCRKVAGGALLEGGRRMPRRLD